jgi:hypothetical protein
MASLIVAGDTSGSITIAAPAVSGSNTLTLPVATDTLVGKATVDTLTNKSIAATQLTGTIAAAALPAGSVLQVVNSQTSTYTSTAVQIPIDNTIPQITEGGQALSLAITPTSATSKLLFQIILMVAPSITANIVGALFQGATSSAISTGWTYVGGGAETILSFNYFMTSGTTSPTTFTVRYGSNGGTIYLNGTSGGQYLGGTLTSSVTITEVAA